MPAATSVFAQYDRVFAFMDEMGPKADPFRPLMFDRAIWHLLVILQREDRVHPSDKERFFARMSETFGRYEPPGHTPPPPEDKPYLAAKYRAIKAGDYRRFQRIRAAEVRRRTARRRLRGAARIGRGGARRLKRLVNRHLYYRAQRRRPIDEQPGRLRRLLVPRLRLQPGGDLREAAGAGPPHPPGVGR